MFGRLIVPFTLLTLYSTKTLLLLIKELRKICFAAICKASDADFLVAST
jgi:hypothetical protein